MDGEEKYGALKDVFMAGLSNGGSLRAFRNEIYCQVIKQTINNPSEYDTVYLIDFQLFLHPIGTLMTSSLSGRRESTVRAWELLSALCGAFHPAEEFVKYLASYLVSHFDTPGQV